VFAIAFQPMAKQINTIACGKLDDRHFFDIFVLIVELRLAPQLAVINKI
jgi:hypothetical protein